MMRIQCRRVGALVGALLLGAAAHTHAQEPPVPPQLPAEVAVEAIDFHNRPETVRFEGELRLASGAEMVGDVAVLGGPVELGGRLRGNLVLINGDLHLRPGARVEGGILVVGGSVTGLENARVTGAVRVYPEALRYRREGELLALAVPSAGAGISTGREFEFGRTDLTLAVRGSYNRVEGLPIALGPQFRLGHSNPTRIDGFVVYRTAAGLVPELDELGWGVRVEQEIGGHGAWRIGVRARSEIVPIEDVGITDRENSLAVFVLHRDYRDYYEREGGSGYLRWSPPNGRNDIWVEYARERHHRVPVRDPWTLLHNSEAWRLQPVVGEGTLGMLRLGFGYDSRSEPRDPSAGWLIRIETERAVDGELSVPVIFAPGGDSAIAATAPAESRYTSAIIDIRRYARLGPSARLSLRLLAAGSLDGGPLPPQRQRTLGGEGSIPGFPRFDFDCGARRAAASLEDGRYFPAYGCDRATLLQLEYRAALPLFSRLARRLDLPPAFADVPSWVAFIDVGRAWTEADARNGRTGGPDNFEADAGLGLRLGPLGFYGAVPLSGAGQGLNFFVRIGSRL